MERADLRASDGDRDAAFERLGDALAEGALDTAEYDRRLERAAAATTLGRLRPLTADLPVSRAALAREAEARKAARAEAGWPLVPLAIWAAVLVSYALWPSKDDRPPDDRGPARVSRTRGRRRWRSSARRR
ncbi:hypothetical protein GCM10010182_14990 [Actinomadura cremea]|nr:hypothetical protein GCM10010182_14990 [Actinomadura cremea]